MAAQLLSILQLLMDFPTVGWKYQTSLLQWFSDYGLISVIGFGVLKHCALYAFVSFLLLF
jgi:hypothetical protein